MQATWAWRNANKKIVSDCGMYQEHYPSNPKVPMIPHHIPDRSWQVVAMNMYMWHGENYFLTVLFFF